jgi:hypothetical protein
MVPKWVGKLRGLWVELRREYLHNAKVRKMPFIYTLPKAAEI